MSRDDMAIRVNGVSKRYVIGRKGRTPLGQLRSKLRYEDVVQAVSDVSFELARGEHVGIVGGNGAGKSTLLRMVCGITQPDSGSVTVDGSLVPVIGLQAGFKNELTGRQNIDIKARLFGMSSEEIDAQRQEIAEFADIGRFIDEPMASYSNGMRARLAFAVAFSVRPEILVVDETLAGGDDAFRRRTMQRLREIKESGTTILLVSHSPAMVRQLCNRAILMDAGSKLFEGKPGAVLEIYQRLSLAASEDREQIRAEIRYQYASDSNASSGDPNQNTKGENDSYLQVTHEGAPVNAAARPKASRITNGARLQDIELHDVMGNVVTETDPEKSYRFVVIGSLEDAAADLRLLLTIHTCEGDKVAELFCEQPGVRTLDRPKGLRAEMGFAPRLVPGTYRVDVELWGRVQDHWLKLHSIEDAVSFRVRGRFRALGVTYVDLGTDSVLTVDA